MLLLFRFCLFLARYQIFFFFNDTAPPEISPLSLPAVLPISPAVHLSNGGNRFQYHPSPRVGVVPDFVFARYGKRALRLVFYPPSVNKGRAVTLFSRNER